MDFEQVLTTLLALLEQGQIRYGVVGGFALGILGVPRATQDFDLLVDREDLSRVHSILKRLGYARHALTENVSHYQPDAAWGSINILHAFRKYSVAMLRRVNTVPVLNGSRQIKVLQPEDLVGLKVQVMTNDPLRASKERADIESLAAAYGSRLDWDRIQEFYELFDLKDEAIMLRRQYAQ